MKTEATMKDVIMSLKSLVGFGFPQEFSDKIEKIITNAESIYVKKKIYESNTPNEYYIFDYENLIMTGVLIQDMDDYDVITETCYSYDDDYKKYDDMKELFVQDPVSYVKMYGKLEYEKQMTNNVLNNYDYFPQSSISYSSDKPLRKTCKFDYNSNKKTGVYKFSNDLIISINKDRYTKVDIDGDYVTAENGKFIITEDYDEEHIIRSNSATFKKFIKDRDILIQFDKYEDTYGLKVTYMLNTSDPYTNPYISLKGNKIVFFGSVDGEEYTITTNDEFEYKELLELSPDKFFDDLIND